MNKQEIIKRQIGVHLGIKAKIIVLGSLLKRFKWKSKRKYITIILKKYNKTRYKKDNMMLI